MRPPHYYSLHKQIIILSASVLRPQGIIYLVMPKDLAWEETLSSRTNKITDERGGDSVEEGEMCEMDEEEEDDAGCLMEKILLGIGSATNPTIVR